MVAQPRQERISDRSAVHRIAIAGVVQGVGFRPFVYRLAERYDIAGWVRNTSSGVEIRAEGDPETLAAFERALADEAPPLAHIESLSASEVNEAPQSESFAILESRSQAGAYQLISPDIAICEDCLRELFDPQDRRYRYPFTNCTNCGPRFTIIEAIPYDRPSTTMAGFAMCPRCQAEYDDPRNRRFHAQPNACPVCGPQVTLRDRDGRALSTGDAAMRAVAGRLLRGDIVALKGLGGYQLACDATNEEAVTRLRANKRRPHKAFAVMVRDLAAAESLADLTEAERALLRRPSAPIVLAHSRGTGVAPSVAPGVNTLGLMLPYTPLHHILLHDVGRPLVMTSGNLSEEPIAQDNDEALARLGGLVDCFLTHDRPVHSRYDDGVWFAPAGRAQPIRRARGDAPYPVTLPVATRPLVALGPELKATFAVTRDRYAFVSQHIGDMENRETLEHHAATLALYEHLFDVHPEAVACDMHPDYHTTRMAAETALPVVRVQHHHAHLASAVADAGHSDPAIGVIWDGTGYGLDGRIWGGEWLVGDARGFVRAARLAYLPLPGGDAATRRPYRIAWAYLANALGYDVAQRVQMPADERHNLERLLRGDAHIAWTSSMGRLFDCVSALLGVRREVSYEGQAAMELEALAGEAAGAQPYPWGTNTEQGVQRWGEVPWGPAETTVVGIGPLLAAIVDDLEHGVSVSDIAARFHVTMADLLVTMAQRLSVESGLDAVALSGGVFQNRLLLELALPRLEAVGLRPVLHRQVPANDGGVSLGQAMVAHYALERERTSAA